MAYQMTERLFINRIIYYDVFKCICHTELRGSYNKLVRTAANAAGLCPEVCFRYVINIQRRCCLVSKTD